ncbi:terminase gpP N-terminus-related DNA-binding protein [Empedobacter falsenii]
MASKKDQERELAKLLYTQQRMSQKDIAQKVGVTEKTITKWKEAENWDKLKESLLITKDSQIRMLYQQLENKNQEIATRKPVRDIPATLLKPIKLKDADGAEYLELPKIKQEDFPIKLGNTATSSEADAIIKITNSIKNLESETGLGEIIDVGMKFIDYVQTNQPGLAKDLTKWYDLFIQSKM